MCIYCLPLFSVSSKRCCYNYKLLIKITEFIRHQMVSEKLRILELVAIEYHHSYLLLFIQFCRFFFSSEVQHAVERLNLCMQSLNKTSSNLYGSLAVCSFLYLFVLFAITITHKHSIKFKCLLRVNKTVLHIRCSFHCWQCF